MHNYTVPSKYKHQTRLGNWSEEWELEETRMKDYLKSKENVNLSTVAKERRLQLSLQKASLTYSQSGIVTFGDHLMIANEKTQGYLACNIYDKQNGVEESYAVTTAKGIHPCSRSVFIIERYTKESDLFQGDQLHFGQKFRIRVNPRLVNKPLYLVSLPMSPQQCAKFSRYQQVVMANKDNINTVWIAETNDPKVRFESNGQLVNVNQPILIKHVLTQQWLGSDNLNYQNIFGNEFEVYGHSHVSHHKTQNLIAEKCGRTTVDIPMRNQNQQNTWSFVSAADPSWEFDEAVLDSSETPQGLINKIRHILIQKGEFGFSGLLESFANMDRNSDGNLDKEDFKWGLRNYGFTFNENEYRLLLDAFDRNKDGFIDFNEFIFTLRGQQSEERQNLIRQVFEHVSQKLGGVIIYSELIKAFQAQKHPDVIKAFKTEQQIFHSFVKAFGKYQANDIISWEQFFSFYLDVSSSIDRDDIFEVAISNVWDFKK